MGPISWRQLALGLPHALFSVLYPDDCRLCSAPLVRFSPAPVCERCLNGITPLAAAGQCFQCGLPFENQAPLHGADLCGLCRRGATEFDWARGYGAYEANLRGLIHLLKYDGMQPLAKLLGRRLVDLLRQAGPVDLIVPVPLDGSRLRTRGFNQSGLLAAELSRASGVALDASVLRRVRRTETQTGLTHRQRRLNMQGAFSVNPKAAIAGKRIALIDDVITTGATAGACTRALKNAGAARVIVLAAARARRRIVDVETASARRAEARAGRAICGA
jgi:ComF family protein